MMRLYDLTEASHLTMVPKKHIRNYGDRALVIPADGPEPRLYDITNLVQIILLYKLGDTQLAVAKLISDACSPRVSERIELGPTSPSLILVYVVDVEKGRGGEIRKHRQYHELVPFARMGESIVRLSLEWLREVRAIPIDDIVDDLSVRAGKVPPHWH